MKKDVRERGAVPSLGFLMIRYNVGDKVHIKINPSIHSGMPHRRYHGKTGEVIGKRGKCYVVKVSLGGKEKILYVRPEHLIPVTSRAEASETLNSAMSQK